MFLAASGRATQAKTRTTFRSLGAITMSLPGVLQAMEKQFKTFGAQFQLIKLQLDRLENQFQEMYANYLAVTDLLVDFDPPANMMPVPNVPMSSSEVILVDDDEYEAHSEEKIIASQVSVELEDAEVLPDIETPGEHRPELAMRYARSQMVKFSAELSEYDATHPEDISQMDTAMLARSILQYLKSIPSSELLMRSRKNVLPMGQKKSEQICLGLVCSANWRGIPMPSRGTYQFRWLTMLILEYAKRMAAAKGIHLQATSIQITKNLQSKPHKDKNNRGPSCIFGLGDWTGGELWVQDNRGRDLLELQEDIEGIGKRGDKLHGQKHSIKDGLIEFDGKRVHGTMEFTGERYAIILYSIGTAYQETPALARGFLQQLGFPLPDADFNAPMDEECERLAALAVQRSPVPDQSDQSDHAPPACQPGGKRRKVHHEAVAEVADDVQWTPEMEEKLTQMKLDKKGKYNWGVVSKRVGVTEEQARRKWKEIQSRSQTQGTLT